MSIFLKNEDQNCIFPEVGDNSSTMMYRGRWGAPGSMGGGEAARGCNMAYTNNIPKFLRFLENRRLKSINFRSVSILSRGREDMSSVAEVHGHSLRACERTN